MFFEPVSKVAFNELNNFINTIELSLIELGRVPIPSSSPGDTWYTYTYAFGQSPLNSISKLIMNFTNFSEELNFQECYIRELLNPEKLRIFISDLHTHLSMPDTYPDIPSFIQERVRLPTVLEPILRSLQTIFELYKIALLGQDKKNEILKVVSEGIEPFGHNEVASLKRLALTANLERPMIVAELKIRHKQLIAQRRSECTENMQGFNALPRL